MPELNFDAVIFDMDGVVTRTASVHAAAWKVLFDEYLKLRASAGRNPYKPFDIKHDYLTYVDGKPRHEGVRSFLESRGIQIPFGDAADEPGKETVHGLAKKKDRIFERILHREGVGIFDSTVALIRALKSSGIKVAIVSSSKHCKEILALARLDGLFDARVDGLVSEELKLKGKPDPDIFLKCAEMLAVQPGRAVVVEDAVSGVQAGRRGRFGLVIGVDRGHNRDALLRNGADLVVSDLAEITIQDINDRFKASG